MPSKGKGKGKGKGDDHGCDGVRPWPTPWVAEGCPGPFRTRGGRLCPPTATLPMPREAPRATGKQRASTRASWLELGGSGRRSLFSGPEAPPLEKGHRRGDAQGRPHVHPTSHPTTWPGRLLQPFLGGVPQGRKRGGKRGGVAPASSLDIFGPGGSTPQTVLSARVRQPEQHGPYAIAFFLWFILLLPFC